MKYALRGITAEELSYTMNRVKMDKDTKFDIKPQFSRTVRRVQENDKIWFLTLEVKVESTDDSPKPFNLKVRLVGAFLGFLNVFSAKYSGKTLSRSDVKSRDEKQLFIDGNLINAERELKKNAKRGEKHPGIIPRSWELRRLSANGEDTLVRAGVTAFRVDDATGDILFSNGSAIIKRDKDGKEEKILSADGVTFIA